MTFLLYPEKTEKETNYKVNNFQNSGNYNHLYVKIWNLEKKHIHHSSQKNWLVFIILLELNTKYWKGMILSLCAMPRNKMIYTAFSRVDSVTTFFVVIF